MTPRRDTEQLACAVWGQYPSNSDSSPARNHSRNCPLSSRCTAGVKVQAPPMLVGSICRSFARGYLSLDHIVNAVTGPWQVTRSKPPREASGTRRSPAVAMLHFDRDRTLGGRSVVERDVKYPGVLTYQGALHRPVRLVRAPVRRHRRPSHRPGAVRSLRRGHDVALAER